MAKKLTKKQEMFCKEYLVDLNATQAAIRAGYSEKTAGVIGDENLKKPYLHDRIQELMNKRASKVEISAEDVLNDILATRNTCKELMLTEDEFGNPMINKDALAGRNKTNELLGKHLKLFTDKVESVNTNLNKDLGDFDSVDEAREYLRKLGIKSE